MKLKPEFVEVNGRKVNLIYLPYDKATQRRFGDNAANNIGEIRSPFASDYTRIGNSNSFRALTDRTQVYADPSLNQDGLIFRSRADHSREIADYIARLAEICGLDVEACKAIILGHDLGHCIYGHAGTVAINLMLQKLGIKRPFDHETQAYRIVTELEYFDSRYPGLNLTYLVRSAFLSRANRGKNEITLAHIEPFPQGFLSLAEQLCEIGDKLYVICCS